MTSPRWWAARLVAACLLLTSCRAGTSDALDQGIDEGVPDEGALLDGPLADLPDGGGADGAPGVSPERSGGTRLRPRVYAAGTGARLFATWRDTMLDVDCSWTRAPDGTIRCLPGPGGFNYANADCTGALYPYPSCAPVPKLVSIGAGSCKPTTVVQIGAAVTPGATIYYRDLTGACYATTPSASQTYYDASTIVPADQFVAATVTREPRGSRLGADVIRAADGAIDARAIVDDQYDYQCDVRYLSSTTDLTCRPLALATTGAWFADAACGTRAAIYRSFDEPFCAATPALISGATGLFWSGAQVSGAVYLENVPCAAATPSPGARYFLEGAPAPADVISSFASTLEGSDRIQLRVATSASGERLLGYGLHDSQRNARCEPAVAADGQTRCLPMEYTSILHKDAACSQAVATVLTGATPPMTTMVIEYVSTCSTRRHVRAVGAKLTAVPLYAWDGANCTPLTSDPASDYYDTTEIPASMFAPLSLMNE